MADGEFLKSPRGPVYIARWSPDRKPVASVLLVPPFAEEMNKCRSMAAMTARALASRGYQVVSVDFTGTGDSSGEFRDARLDGWRQDLRLVVDWASSAGAPVTGIVGMRFGALLGLELARSLEAGLRIALWQPVASGSMQLNQFLRLRVAGAILAADEGGRGAESVASLIAGLKAGSTYEVAGYELHPELAAGLETVELRGLTPPAGARLRWFELGAGDSPALSRVATDRLREWVAAGIAADGVALAGDPFWSTVELTWSPELAGRTADFLAGEGGA